VDDSKATNPHAAAASLNSFENIIWIAGGLLKGVDITPLIDEFKSRIKAVVIIGADRQPVVDALTKIDSNIPAIEITAPDTMHEVVAQARKLAAAGDVVLLAPAAASMDQFKDYADRGKQFAHQVKIQLGLM
jgi:UDP-N-acetylmuramoylalanine--D-glutamate ligase